MSATRPATGTVPVSLVVVSPESERTIIIDHSPFTIGRKNTNDVCLLDPHISREQATITKEEDGYYIEDRGSTHGTLIGGARVTKQKLNPGDKVQFGGTAAIYLIFAPERTTSHVREFLTQVSSMKSSGNAAELERLTLCLQVARKLTSANVLDEILETLVDATLRLTGADARDDESDRPLAEHGPVGEHAAVEKQPLELVFAPAATKRGAVQRRKRRSIARTRFTQHRLRPAEEAGE